MHAVKDVTWAQPVPAFRNRLVSQRTRIPLSHRGFRERQFGLSPSTGPQAFLLICLPLVKEQIEGVSSSEQILRPVAHGI